MGKLYLSCAILYFITILLLMGFAICTCFSTNRTSFGCILGERKALLKLKSSFEDPFNRLSSWHTSTDCCTWKGVVCDSNTNHVIGLRLRNTHWSRYCWNGIKPQIGAPESLDCNYNLRSSQLDSSLLELNYLSYLDLSGNDFQLSPIPAFLGSMKQLQHLNLSRANFGGIVPHNLGNLLSLQVLDLNNEYFLDNTPDLMVDDLMWAANLSMLEHLDMSGFDLSRAKHLSEVLFHMLPSLLVLCLSQTQLDNTLLPYSCVNSSLLTNIQHLDLSYNSFQGELPCFLYNMTSIKVLDLSYNFYNSSRPHAFLRLINLVHLDLSYNSHHRKGDWISEFLLDKCHLKSLILADNYFYGELSAIFFRNLSLRYCWTHKLETLVLNGNQFEGPIPTSIGKLRALRYLWLGDNQLSGEIPNSLGQLPDLEKIDISSNSFSGTILFEHHFAKLSKLEYLWADSINLSVAFDWVPPFQLKWLSLSSCTIGGGQFPQWLRTQKALETLFLSNCSISGSLPQWLHYFNLTAIILPYNLITSPIPKLPSNLKHLDMSHNMINGLIPKLPPDLKELYLSHNQIEGPIPELGFNLYSLSLSNNIMNGSIPDSLCKLKVLSLLDLSMNQFSSYIPYCLTALPNLRMLRLSSNELSGVIPNSIGEASSLGWLDLSKNSLTGSLPSTLKKCTSLSVLDVGENMLFGNLPDWIGTHLPDLHAIRLVKNEFHGVIPSTFCRLLNLLVMDLSNNKLTGNISHCFGNLLSMVETNANMRRPPIPYSPRRLYPPPSRSPPVGMVDLKQVMKGIELEYTSTLRYLVNLDLSSNNLVGEIPWELTNLSGLNGLNLSHNRLVGEIPTNIGDLKCLESLDLSSNNLHGAIPWSLSDMDTLEYLNLSHNHLSGPIPTGHHFQTLDDTSIYVGNPGLCGDPLPKKCQDDGASKSPNIDENNGALDEDEKNEQIILYGIIASGFATGFWGIIGFLVLKRNWRLAFFQFAEDMTCKMLGL